MYAAFEQTTVTEYAYIMITPPGSFTPAVSQDLCLLFPDELHSCFLHFLCAEPNKEKGWKMLIHVNFVIQFVEHFALH